MSQFALELHPDKTRLIEFGRFAMANRQARGARRPETFDFLGFTHYCKTKRNGKVLIYRVPRAGVKFVTCEPLVKLVGIATIATRCGPGALESAVSLGCRFGVWSL